MSLSAYDVCLPIPIVGDVLAGSLNAVSAASSDTASSGAFPGGGRSFELRYRYSMFYYSVQCHLFYYGTGYEEKIGLDDQILPKEVPLKNAAK